MFVKFLPGVVRSGAWLWYDDYDERTESGLDTFGCGVDIRDERIEIATIYSADIILTDHSRFFNDGENVILEKCKILFVVIGLDLDGYREEIISFDIDRFVRRILEITGDPPHRDWSKLAGKKVRAKVSFNHIDQIGHIVNDDWIDPIKDFAEKPKEGE